MAALIEYWPTSAKWNGTPGQMVRNDFGKQFEVGERIVSTSPIYYHVVYLCKDCDKVLSQAQAARHSRKDCRHPYYNPPEDGW